MTTLGKMVMDDQAVRDQLAAVLLEHSPVYSEVHDEQRCACGAPLWDGIDVHHAAALLPVARGIAADELRRAYIEDSTTVAQLSPVERLTCRIVKVEDLLPRITALAPTERMP